MQARVAALAALDAEETLRPVEAVRELLREHPMCVPYMHPDVPQDAIFSELAEKRDALLSDPERNAEPLRAVEEAMQERAVQVAVQHKRRTRSQRRLSTVQMTHVEPEKAGEVQEQEADTVPLLSGTEVRDPYYQELMALRASLAEEGPRRDADKIRAVEEQMKDRAVQLDKDNERAAAARERVRGALLEQHPFLPKQLHGIPLEDLPLRDDDEFVDAEQEHARLAAEPVRNAEALRAAVDRMRARAEKVASVAAATEEALRERLPFVEVGKVPLRSMGLESWPEFAALQAQLEELAKDPAAAKGPEARRLEKAMMDLAKLRAYDEAAATQCDAVKEADLHDRFPFLPEEPVPGMPLAEAELMADPEFRTLANALEDLRRSPHTSPQALRAAEEALAGRAAEAAATKLRATEEAQARYPFLSKRVAGVPLSELPLAHDELFQALVAQRAPLLREPEANAQPLRAVEDQLRSRAAVLAGAKEKLDAIHAADNDEVRARNPFLPYNDVCGVPLRELGLPQDAEYVDKWLDRLQLMEHPEENRPAIQAVEGALRGRAEELARDKLRAEDELLAKHPFVARPPGAPLLASLGVPADEQFRQLAQEHAVLAEEPVRNAEPLRAVEEAMQARVAALAALDAEETLRPVEAVRELLREHPMCVPYMHPDVPQDAIFSELAEKRDALLSDPERNAEPLRAVEEAMQERAVQVAVQHKRRTRSQRRLSTVQMTHVEPEKAGEVQEQEADTVPLLSGTEVRDPYYQELMALRASLAEEGPRRDADKIRAVEEQMKDRAVQLDKDNERAAAARERVRGALLEQHPFLPKQLHGIPLEDLPLRDDDEFVDAEQEHARLAAEPVRNAEALRAAVDRMRARAEKVASVAAATEEALRERLPFVEVGKVPLRSMGLESWPEFASLQAQLEELAKDPAAAKGPEARRLEKAMMDLAKLRAYDEAAATQCDAVKEADLHDRFPFLPEEPVPGMPLAEAELMADPEFRTLANALEDLRRSPHTSPQALRAAEEALAGRAAEAAATKLRATEEAQARYPFLSKRVAGVPLSELPLAHDELFQALVAQRAPLLREPEANAQPLRAVEDQLRSRAAVLAGAKEKLDAIHAADNDEVRARNPFLPYNDVCGVPLRELGLPQDAEYVDKWLDRLQLMEHPEENRPAIQAVEGALRGRAEELARDKLRAEDELLAKHPFVARPPGAPLLASLGVPADEQFRQLAQEHAVLAEEPVRNAEPLRAVEEAMQARVAALAALDAEETLRPVEAVRELLREHPMCVPYMHPDVPQDAIFSELAEKRDALLSDPERNAEPLRAVEEAMQERAVQVAVQHKRRTRSQRRLSTVQMTHVEPEKAGEVQEQEADTVPLLSGTEVRDPYYQELMALRASLAEEGPRRDADKIRAVEEQMKDRAVQLDKDNERAAAARERVRGALLEQHPFLPKQLHGIPLEDLPLRDDDEFVDAEQEHARLAAEPVRNAEALRAAVDRMRARAEKVASVAAATEEALRERLPFVEVGKVPLRSMGLESWPEFAALQAQLEELAKDPAAAKGPEARRLEKAMMDLAKLRAYDEAAATQCDAVKEADLHDRFPFLPEEPVPGMPLAEAELMADPEFRTLANALEDLRRSPHTSPQALRAAEEALAGRAAEAAATKLRATEEAQARYPFLSKRVAGVPLSELPLAHDELFQALVAQRAPLLREPEANAQPLRAVEDQLRSRAAVLAGAKEKLDAIHAADNDEVRARNPFLPYNDVCGVPLRELGLPQDAEYVDKWLDRLQLMEHPEENRPAIQAVEGALRGRAEELARDKLRAEDELLAKHPFVARPPGAPLLASLGVPADEQFRQLAQEHAVLAEEPVRNAEPLRAVEEAMQARVAALAALDAEETLRPVEAVRELLREHPMCVPYMHPDVPQDAIFSELAEKRDALLSDPERNAEPLRAVEEAMQERAVQVAVQHKRRTRSQRRLSTVQMTHVEPEKAGEVQEQEADTVPLLSGTEVRDSYYQELMALRASLVKEDETVNADSIRCVEEQMKDRVAQLKSDAARARAAQMRAEAALVARYPFLVSSVTGEMLTAVRVEDDAVFVGLAAEYASLKATPTTSQQALKCVEHGMRVRASELVAEHARDEEALRRLMPFVGALPGGVTLRELDLANDPEVRPLLAQLEELANDPASAKGPEARRLEKTISELARRAAEDEAARTLHSLVDAEGLHDRFPFLPEEPVPGMPLAEAELMADPEFRTLANALEDLRRSPHTSPQALRAAEEALAGRAAEAAATKLRATEEAQARYPFLSKRVAGVPLSELPLAHDELFQALVAQRAPLLGSPRTNAARLHAIEAHAQDRARELASAKRNLDGLRDAADDEVRARNPFLSYNDVRGVPLRELGLSRDPEYAQLTDRRLTLKEQPVEAVAELTAVEARLKVRATEVAEAKLVAEAALRAKYPTVATAPEAAMLSSLELTLDPRLVQLEQQCVALADAAKADDAPLRAAEEAAAARVQELVEEDAVAEEEAAQARAAVLRRYPMCARDVTEAVGKDAMFASLSARHAGLLSDPAANREPLADVEDLMRQRSAEVESGRRQRRRRGPANPPRLLDMNDVALESGEMDDYHSRRHRHRRVRILDAREVPIDIAGEVHEQQDEVNLPPRARRAAAPCHSDSYYQELMALRASLVKEDETVNADSIRCVEEQMKDRVAQLKSDAARARAAQMRAEAALVARYPFLVSSVTGEMLTAVRVEDDAVFVGLAAEYASLKATPTTSQQALKCVEHGMRVRASELVAEHARDEEALRRLMPFVGALPGGVTLRELDLANDPEVRPLLAQLEELANDPASAKGPEARRLEKTISELARRAAEDEAARTLHSLVDAEGLHDRFPFLPEEPVPGMPLAEAELMADPEFRTLANALEDLRRSPHTSPQALRAAEEALAGRAAEAAATKLRATEEAQARYPFLSKRVAGVPLSELPLAHDELFQALVAQRAPLLGSPRTNAARLHAIEAHAQDRARELASAKRNLDGLRDAADDEVRARNPFLSYNDVRGVPLRELGLSRDPEYAQLTDRRLTLKEQPVEAVAELTAVEARLKVRATEVAEAKLVAEAALRAKYPTVATAPEAAMLSSLELTLDPRLVQLEQQCVALADAAKADDAPLRAAEEAAAARVQELVEEDAVAEEEAAQARAAVLRRYPMCARDVTEAVGKDAMFASLSARHAGLLSDPAANREPLADVEDLMRQRSAEVESGRRQRRRRGPANPPRLLDMNDVALESGEMDDYHSRRHRHRRVRILDAREVPIDIAGEVHEQQDEVNLPPRARRAAAPCHSDSYYQELMALRASLVKEDETVNADSIRCVEEQMKDRVAQLKSDAARARAAQMRAEAALVARYPFLVSSVTGEMLTAVRVEDDAVFVGLAAEYASLKATPTTSQQALKCVEHGMRVRASELVAEHARDEEALRRLMPFVGALPGGVTLRELDLANDPEVRPLLAQLEELANDPASAKGPEARRLEKTISELARRAAEDEAARTLHSLVDAEGLHDRFPFLPEEPVPGMPLAEAELMADPEFRTLANALEDLRRSPHTSPQALRAAEEALAGRAAEAAATKLRATEEAQARYPFLSKRVAGVPLSELPLAHDELFQALVAQRAPLLGSPRTNAARLHAIEAHAQDRARELASAKRNLDGLRDAADDEVRARNPFLSYNDVRGVPLRELGLSRDPEYAQLTDRRLTLKEQPVEAVAELTAVEARLKVRATEVAEAKLVAEAALRAKYPTVATAPEAAMLSSLELTLDPRLVQLEQQCVALADAAKADDAPLRAAEEAAAARVQELVEEDAVAEEEAAQARAAVLRRYPMCARDVTEAVGKDAMFASLSARHAGLLSDPAANREPLADVEDLMRQRSAEVESGRRQRRRRGPANPPRLLDMNDVALESGEMDDYHSRRHRHRRVRILDAREVPIDIAGEVHEQQDEVNLPPRARRAAAPCHSDSYYQELMALRASLVKEDETVNADSIRCVEEQMKDRVAQLKSDAARARAAQMRAEAALVARYPFLVSSVTGEMLTAVRVEDDAVFVGLAAEYASLKATPTTSQQALKCVEHGMRVRASELVAEHARDEEALRRLMPFVGALPGGVTLRELDLANDPEVRPLLAQLEELANDPASAKGPEARRLEKTISELARRAAEDEAARTLHSLVDAEGLHDRFPFLPEEPVPGMPLAEAELMADPEFRTLANALEDLRRSPHTSPQALRAAEEALAGRAAEAAATKLRATEEAQARYPFLSKRVAGVPLSELPLAHDELFQALVAQRAPLLGSPRTNAARLHAIEAHAQDRARELASAKRNLDGLRDAADDEVRARNPFLSYNDVRGVPLRELGLSRDPEYAQLTDRRLTLKEQPVEAVAELTAVEARLKVRATEVAEAKLVAEAALRAKYPTVATAPEAAMLSSLELTLDPRLVQLEQQCVALADAAKADDAPLRAAEEAAAARVQELVEEDAVAEEEAAQARAAVLRRYPMCARDVTEAVGKDAMFASLSARHAGLLSDPAANREPLADVEDLMRQRSAEVESGRRQRRRRGPANPPRLLDMNDVALESGEMDDYHSRRHRHRRVRILDAREVPIDIAGEVHEQQDEVNLPPRARRAAAPCHSDSYYQELMALRASLVKEDETVNADSIRCVEEQMKDRVAQLKSDAARARAAQMRAEAALVARYPFLVSSVTGEMLTAVRVEDDAVFVGLAAEYASLKATPTTSQQALKCVEHGMRVRASELVAEHARDEEALRRLMPFVGALPGGVTLRELDLANDPEVRPLLAQLEELANDPASAKGPEARRLEKTISELARRAAEDEAARTLHSLVDAEGLHERFPFLPEEPVPGVSLVEAGVLNDPEFRTLANALEDLRRDPCASESAAMVFQQNMAEWQSV
ncbi:tb-292 membrane associated protein-like protein [Leishmania tarentolae]|uniref:Tb-292 membrane associated protein-like protein n=1 Tax=Leishmania tarentolae TaxID=5689 RepID=A0A640KDL5_LEITA|nr:tb-292 membrane associated protein-like protein [Leishmania tarentolae]